MTLSSNELFNEKELLSRVAEGDEAAFASLYAHYYPQLQPLVWKYAGSGIEAEEILQETFLKVWLNRDRLIEVENFRAWIFKIASREYLTALRKKLRYESKLSNYSSLTDAKLSPVAPDEVTHLEAIKRAIAEAVSRLAPQRRIIYEMSRNQGLTIDEIARRLSIAPRTVKNVLTIVLKYIRDYLNSAGYGPFLMLYYLITINS